LACRAGSDIESAGEAYVAMNCAEWCTCFVVVKIGCSLVKVVFVGSCRSGQRYCLTMDLGSCCY
jgi:hypothetical protein